MNSLRADITALLDRARADGSKVVAIEAVERALKPKHLLTIDDHDRRGGWDVEHPRACREAADCDVAWALRTAPLLSSPHARGRSYEVWLEDGALKFLDVTP